MIVDLRSVEPDAVLRADVCVAGAGAAGIALARALDAAGVATCILESGGFELDPATQDLYAATDVGLPDPWTAIGGRLRYFGGTTNHWGGWCAPMTEIDFAARDWVAGSGWPFARAALDPYYERAGAVCGLGPLADPASLRPDTLQLPDFDAEKLVPRYWRYAEPVARFGLRYRTELERSAAVRVLLHANLVELELDADGRSIARAIAANLDGRRIAIEARCFVLACGGIENARLLLLQDRERPAGLGNENDLVGRNYMTHLHIRSADVITPDPHRLGATFDRHGAPPEYARVGLFLADAAQRRHAALGFSATLDRRIDQGSGFFALRGIARDLEAGRAPDAFGERLSRVLRDAGATIEDLWRHLSEEHYQASVEGIDVYTRSEQAPNPDSRIVLGGERDALGQRRAQRDWRLTAQDRDTLRLGHRLLAEELGRLDIGRVRLPGWLLQDDAPWPEKLSSFGHHMGTTRMSDDPRLGVVDADCRLHSVENLYVSGGSVFPAVGCMNPTLTIVALALRLADHLLARLRG